MSRVEREPKATKPLDVEPGAPGPGPDELVASGDIDEPVPHGMFLELLNLMATLKERRQAMGLSLTDVSERSGLTRQAISRLENGWNNNPTLETVYRYALALDAGVTLGVEDLEPEGVEEQNNPATEAHPRPAAGLPKTIVLMFEGGFKDGKWLSTASPDPVVIREALSFYSMSSQGEIGRRHWAISDAGLQEMREIPVEHTPDGLRLAREPIFSKRHIYEVVNRIETDDTITVRFRFVATED